MSARRVRRPRLRAHFLIQLASHAANAAAGLTISILAAGLGASPWEIGLIAAAYGSAQFAASWIFGRAADVYGRRRLLKIGLAVTTVAALAHALARDPLALGAARAAFGFAAGVYPAALTSLAFDANRRLGRFQSFGSLGYALGVLAGGAVAESFGSAVFLLAAALFGVSFLASLTIVYPPEHTVVVPVFPREVIERNLPAYAAMVIRHAGATAAWVVFPLYLLDLGASLAWVGVVNAVNGAFQFAFMRTTDRFPPRLLVVAGLALSAAAFAAFALAPDYRWVLAAQPLLAAGWAALYMGALRFSLYRSVERATATGLLTSSVQLASIIGPLAGGAVAQALGLRATMWLGCGAALLAVPLFYYELARHPARERDLAEERVAALLGR